MRGTRPFSGEGFPGEDSREGELRKSERQPPHS
jgi:hypothetical protein